MARGRSTGADLSALFCEGQQFEDLWISTGTDDAALRVREGADDQDVLYPALHPQNAGNMTDRGIAPEHIKGWCFLPDRAVRKRGYGAADFARGAGLSFTVAGQMGHPKGARFQDPKTDARFAACRRGKSSLVLIHTHTNAPHLSAALQRDSSGMRSGFMAITTFCERMTNQRPAEKLKSRIGTYGLRIMVGISYRKALERQRRMAQGNERFTVFPLQEAAGVVAPDLTGVRGAMAARIRGSRLKWTKSHRIPVMPRS